jgi:hypothetical protein
MKTPPNTAKVIRSVLLAFLVVGAFEGFQIADMPPEARSGRIFSLIMALATGGLIVVLSLRKRALSPESPRLSRFTLLAIAVSLILIAALVRPSKIWPTVAPGFHGASGINWQLLGGLFVLTAGMYVTLWAYGIVSLAQRELLPPSMVQRLKWLGPVTVLVGLFEIVFRGRS